MTTPRLAVFVPNLEDGAPQRAMVALANGLRRRGLSVDVVAPMGGGPLRAALDPGIGQIDLARRHTRTSVLALARILAERRPAGLLSLGGDVGLVALGAALLARRGTPVAVVGDVDGNGWGRRTLARLLRPRAAVVVDGRDDAEALALRCLAAFRLMRGDGA